MKHHFSAYIWLAAGMALAGSSVVVGKIVIGVFPVFLSQTITLLISLVGIFPLAWLIEGNVFKIQFQKRDFLFLFLQALTGMFLFRVFLLYGLKFTSATEGGIITQQRPGRIITVVILDVKRADSSKSLAGYCCLCCRNSAHQHHRRGGRK